MLPVHLHRYASFPNAFIEALLHRTMKPAYSFFAVTILVLLTATSVCAATVTRDMPTTVAPGSTFTVRLHVTSATVGKTFTLEETRPLQVDQISWTIDGASEAADAIQTRSKGQGFGWSFTPAGPEATITYQAKVSPSATGPLEFEAIYFDPNGFNNNNARLIVAKPESEQSRANQPQTSNPETSTSSTPATTSSSPASKTPSSESITGASRKPSVVIGLLVVGLIVLIGIGLFYYFTTPKKNKLSRKF